MPKIKISVMGAAGRMGRELIRALTANASCSLLGGIEPAGSPSLGKDLGELSGLGALGISVTQDALSLIAQSDAILDFTTPQASIEFAGYAANARIVHVLGTTGLDAKAEAAIIAAARHATIIQSGNMSLGVALAAALTRKMAEVLKPDYDIEILEMHHRHKVDAPSGTALMLGRAAAAGRGVPLSDVAVRSRDGHTGARRKGDIGFATLRGGSVIGDHEVIFAGEGEEIRIRHHASDRGIFARGAVTAALWGQGKGPGLFSMSDVLGL